MTMRGQPSGESADVLDYTSAEQRWAFDRVWNRVMWIIALILLAWLAIGSFRDPPASPTERSIAGVFAASLGGLLQCGAIYGIFYGAFKVRDHLGSR